MSFDSSGREQTELYCRSVLRYSSLIAFCIGLLLVGCQTETKQQFKLTSKERRKVDTLYRAAADSLQPYMDSLCEVQFDDQVRQYTDSLVQVRLAQEARLRARYQDSERNLSIE